MGLLLDSGNLAAPDTGDVLDAFPLYAAPLNNGFGIEALLPGVIRKSLNWLTGAALVEELSRDIPFGMSLSCSREDGKAGVIYTISTGQLMPIFKAKWAPRHAQTLQ